MGLHVIEVGKWIENSFSYSWKDTVLYALSVGAKRDDELAYLYEGQGPQVFSTFAVVPCVEVCKELIEMSGGDVTGMVHSSQQLECFKPFASQGTLTVKGKIDGMYDLRRFAQVDLVTELHNAQDELVCRMKWTLLFLKDGGFDGPRPPKKPRVKIPDRDPDFEVREAMTKEQALLYRLNGDINPIHADPKVAATLGFEQPILHGLCTFGFIERALRKEKVLEVSSGFSLTGQFNKPIFPGETLVTQGFSDESGWVLQAYSTERPEEKVFTQGQLIV